MAGIVGVSSVDSNNADLYFQQRRRWSHPQAMLWADNPGEVISSGSKTGVTRPFGNEGDNFIVTSDHSRSAIDIDKLRIENRQRMVNGFMRSYWTDDKITLNCSWNLLPSRAFSGIGEFDETGFLQENYYACEFTADRGAGGVDMLDWYGRTTGPMWVYLAYDRYDNHEGAADKFALNYDYSSRHLMYFTSFTYSVEKRGIYDMWNISVSLEEA